ncbi:uncharacterized protein YALI1_A16832g [Yarrowia lipolytica]|uniref:Uncharacterized protein n=1 Tax=Yarrowia lipolytica TaxID=4952 RepID=A0A1D8N564_YARLL|nr:hypothetical protein YALI1_A16832g [Yarrowia lipolytica]
MISMGTCTARLSSLSHPEFVHALLIIARLSFFHMMKEAAVCGEMMRLGSKTGGGWLFVSNCNISSWLVCYRPYCIISMKPVIIGTSC